MAGYFGDIPLGDTIDMQECFVQATGAPTTLSGSPVVSAYPDNSITQLTAGITLTVDHDGITGAINTRVAATGANGYLQGSNYCCKVTTGTVNAVSVVGYPVGSFSIQKRSNSILNAGVGAFLPAGIIESGTLQSATATTAVLRAASTTWANTRPVGFTIAITGGTGVGQSRPFTGYTESSKTVTVDTWTTTPDNTSTYIIYPTAPSSTSAPPVANVTQWLGTAVGAATAGVPNTNAAAINNVSTSPVTTVAANIGSATAITGDPYARLGAPAGASVSADIAAAKADTAAIKVKTDALTTSGIKKNTALAAFEFPIYSATDHVTPLTGVSPTVQRSINGGAFGAATNTPAVEIGVSGRYKIDLSAADLNGDTIEFKATAVGADPMDWTIVTVS